MKPILLLLRLVPAVLLFGPSLNAANSDFEIHCIPKRLDQNVKSASDGGAAVTKERWGYDVAIENKTFKTLSDLEVKYVIFFSQEQLGVKAAPTLRRQTGTFTIPTFQSHQKKMFTTDSVELKKAHLVGAWHYRSGAKPNATDTLAGLWVRVYQNGQLLAEYANPSTLMRERWE